LQRVLQVSQVKQVLSAWQVSQVPLQVKQIDPSGKHVATCVGWPMVDMAAPGVPIRTSRSKSSIG
jgi:hypothetical protein